MSVKKIGIFFMILSFAEISSASMWGKIKNAINNCKYSQEEYMEAVKTEMSRTDHLPEYFSGAFSDSDFKGKPWINDFRYVIVVNKSSVGPSAQTMRVYENGRLIRRVKVSTGREGFELRRKKPVCTGAPFQSYWSQTPTGFYTPKFLSRYHVSSSWDADMPFAIFYDVENGLALHQVSPKYENLLGRRASGGCTRQDSVTAEEMFNRVAVTEGATIPMIDVSGNPVLTDSGAVRYINKQIVQNQETGELVRYSTYSALIIVEDVN
ncbi:L,D-transpeptidase [Bdellovibrio sp.]|uniref:L,D-transpeptidase n=1 Tax=Bdellovibrio sp. TaxID=28201 RepID=UPI0039E4932C